MNEQQLDKHSPEEMFSTIDQHWAHFLERDIAPEAPPVQVHEMKRAFAAGAVSGLALVVKGMSEKKGDDLKADIRAHIQGIRNLTPKKVPA